MGNTSLQDLIPQTYFSVSLASVENLFEHVFSDASKQAVAAVGYPLHQNEEGNSEMGFIIGKSKVAQKHSNTIPRLELCRAVLAVEIAETISLH
jgi:hypothetical protein